jgi:hypothetical protein
LTVYVDLWQLPDAKLTRSLATAVEANYYARLPPDERPRAFREQDDQETSHPEEKLASEEIESGMVMTDCISITF